MDTSDEAFLSFDSTQLSIAAESFHQIRIKYLQGCNLLFSRGLHNKSRLSVIYVVKNSPAPYFLPSEFVSDSFRSSLVHLSTFHGINKIFSLCNTKMPLGDV